MITKEKKAQAIASTQRTKTDNGSPEVQVAITTARIKELTEHLKVNKHDYAARRGLLKLVGLRKRMLAYLADKDFPAYQALIQKLGLRK